MLRNKSMTNAKKASAMKKGSVSSKKSSNFQAWSICLILFLGLRPVAGICGQVVGFCGRIVGKSAEQNLKAVSAGSKHCHFLKNGRFRQNVDEPKKTSQSTRNISKNKKNNLDANLCYKRSPRDACPQLLLRFGGVCENGEQDCKTLNPTP